jgi:predicted dehydrogenase
MARKLRVGAIGTGAISQQQHLPSWQELEAEGRVELVAVCDVVEQRAEESKETFGARKAYTDYTDMLAREDLDIVDICTQNRLHHATTMAALEAGAHVLVEKPIAMNTAEAEEMVETARKKGLTLMVAQHLRFAPEHEKMKAVIDRGDLGAIYTGNAVWVRRRGIPGWGRFHVKSESLGGPLIDIGVHMMDLCAWYMGNPRPVAASGKVYRMFGDRPDYVAGPAPRGYPPEEFDVEDYALGMVRFENEATMLVEVSWAVNGPDRMQVNVFGDRAGVSTSPATLYGYDESTVTTTTYEGLPQERPHRRLIRHYTDCIENDRPVIVQPEQSLAIQKIIDAIYLSSEQNAEVAIP